MSDTPPSGTEKSVSDTPTMITPYGAILKSMQDAFSKIGFSKTGETEYTASFSNGEYSVEIATERYYQPSVSSSVVDKDGNTYAVCLLREILEPAQFHKDLTELDAIEQTYFLESYSRSGTSKELRNLGIHAHVALSFKQLIAFLKSNNDALASGSYKEQYARKDKAH